jgi:cytochrome c2
MSPRQNLLQNLNTTCAILTAFSFHLCEIANAGDALHPLFELENVYPSNDVQLKVSAMTFMGDDLYMTVFTPDRTNIAPFMDGEVFKVTGLIGNSDRSKIQATRLMGGLYEPTAIANFTGSIYIGEKDKISRLDDLNGNGIFEANEKKVLMDGLSQPNFHTYTIGFEIVEQEGKTYLAGNLTTSIKIGGSREYNVTVNPKTRRGSTFLFGPITGKENATDVDIKYIAGGYRTPNGIGSGENQSLIVVDNQGVFNPANELIRITPGSFYGHYLLDQKNANTSAFQPDHVDSVVGGSQHQSPATVYLPQESVARSPAQPMMLKKLEAQMAMYNGQFLIPDITKGRITRVFTEQVAERWQGAVFLHSGGHDAEGKVGFTAGPNRMMEGPDGKYYLGHIGHGGLWQFLGKPEKPHWGLQRMTIKKASEFPKDFNEMVAIRDIVDGLEIEFFSPVRADDLTADKISISQWTYIPTNGYGGPNIGTETLKATKLQHSEDGKKLRLTIPGIRDNSPPFIKNKGYSNENVGWVIELQLDGLGLWSNQAWYTMHHHQRSAGSAKLTEIDGNDIKDPNAYASSLYKSVCAACHAMDGAQLVGPNLNGIHGREQIVIRDGKEISATIDDAYILRALSDPLAEHPKGFQPAMPNPGLNAMEQQAVLNWLKSQK